MKYWASYSVANLPSFTSQEKLNISLSRVAPAYRLESDDVNPLTIRLLVTNEAIVNLTEYLQIRSDAVRISEEQKRKQIQQHYQLGNSPTGQVVINPFWSTSGSGIASWRPTLEIHKPHGHSFASAPPEFQDTGSGWSVTLPDEFHPVKAHIAIYSFFTNFASVLDRFAHEVHLLFPPSKSIKNWNWGRLFDEPYKSDLARKDAALALEIDHHHKQLVANRTSRYRHVLSHQGYLPVKGEFNNAAQAWKIMLPEDPENNSSPRTVDAPSFMLQELERLLVFLDKVYNHILGKLSSSLPPW